MLSGCLHGNAPLSLPGREIAGQKKLIHPEHAV
jgi:hypothetical protein